MLFKFSQRAEEPANFLVALAPDFFSKRLRLRLLVFLFKRLRLRLPSPDKVSNEKGDKHCFTPKKFFCDRLDINY